MTKGFKRSIEFSELLYWHNKLQMAKYAISWFWNYNLKTIEKIDVS